MKTSTVICVLLLAAGSMLMTFNSAQDQCGHNVALHPATSRANLAPWENTTAPLQDYSLPEDFGEDSKHINLKQAFQDDDTVNNLTFDFEYQVGGGKIKVYDISNAAGTVTLRSTANWHGTETITFVATDNQFAEGRIDVTITVWAVNDPPTRTNIAFYSLEIDQGGVASWQDPNYAFLDLSTEFVDNADQEVLEFGCTYAKTPHNVTAEVDEDSGQTVVSTFDEYWWGTETITFWAKDAGNDTIAGNSDDAMMSAPLYITYKDVNDAVIFNATPDFVCKEDQWFNYTLQAYDPGDKADKITWSTNIQSVIPSLSTTKKNYAFDTKKGIVCILADNDNVGLYKGVFFQASDGRGSNPRHIINITFQNTNDDPIARIVNLPMEGYYNTTMLIQFNGSESEDVDVRNGDVLTYIWTSNITGKIGEGRILNATLPQAGMHMIWLNITDKAGRPSSTNTTIKVIKERAWGEAMLELSGTSKDWKDIDNNDVFWYNATTDGVNMRKGDVDKSYDLTDVSYKIVGNRIEITITAKGDILDSSGITGTEMNYFVYFVKPGHTESPVNVNVTSTRPRMYEPTSLNSYGWVGIVDGKVKWSENIYTKNVVVSKNITDNELVLSMYVSDFERIGGRSDFELFATSVCVISKSATVSEAGMIWTFYDSVGEGSVKAPDSWGNLIFKNPDDGKDDELPIGTIVFVAVIVLAILIIIIIVILVIRSVAKPVEQPTYDYSKLRQKDEDYTDFESGPDNRYHNQNLYGSTGSRAPVGAVAYQPTPGQTYSPQNMMTDTVPTQPQPQAPPPQQAGMPPAAQMVPQQQAQGQPLQGPPLQNPPAQPGQPGK